MNDRELNSILKSVRVPDRAPDYWDDFPGRVRVQLRPGVTVGRRAALWPRLAWAGGLAFAGLFLFMTLWPVHLALKNQKMFRHELAELPKQLKTFMADEHGMHYLVVEKE